MTSSESFHVLFVTKLFVYCLCDITVNAAFKLFVVAIVQNRHYLLSFNKLWTSYINAL